MEPTLPLHHVLQVRELVRRSSTPPPRNRLFQNHPSLPDNQNKICLNLQMWANVFAESVDTVDTQRSRIDKLLNFFINVATRNGLETTPAVQSLQDALSILRRGDDFSRLAKIQWRERISQLSVPTKTTQKLIENLGKLCIHGAPLFNIWDSMAFLYTLCVEDVKTQLGAELHLYQFRLIIAAFRACTYFPKYAGPVTVAASWTEETPDHPLSLAFATSCVGERDKRNKPTDDPTRETMCAARREFMKTITDKLQNLSTVVNNSIPPNKEGNCPEYMAWPIVCRQIGRYKSLCLTMQQDPDAYQCCGYCESTREHLNANKIQIDDLWKTSSLTIGPIKNVGNAYPARGLKSLGEILNEYGHLNNL
jgi:hypothetical protein